MRLLLAITPNLDLGGLFHSSDYSMMVKGADRAVSLGMEGMEH